MRIGMVGLGKMGGNMALRLRQAGHEVAAYDRDPAALAEAAADGVIAAADVQDLIAQLPAPHVVWIMVPSGLPTENVIQELTPLLLAGDIIIDGGNSNYKDTIRRAEALSSLGVHLVDVGTSGGIWGVTEGYSMMVGGNPDAVAHLRPIFEALAPQVDQGWGHVGPVGAGHFVKMVHNGIEYGMMQAYAEGFEILKSKPGLNLDVHQIAEIWRHGSVVRSWLLDLTARALEADPDLTAIQGWVADSGEGRWTVLEAMELDIPAPVINMALMMRFVSRQEDSYAAKLLAALRNQFGGHAVKLEE